MAKSIIILENEFVRFFKPKLGKYYVGSFALFKQYGPAHSYVISTVFISAIQHEKLDFVLEELEKWTRHDEFENHDITEERLRKLNARIMGLQYTPKALRV